MTRRSIAMPGIVADLLADRTALATLGAACLTIAAAGLDPHVLDPSGTRARDALASDTGLTTLLSIAAIIQAAFILVGGAMADLWRSVRLLRAALIGLVIASIGAAVVSDGPGLLAFRVLAWACDGVIIPFAVAVVAQLYRGETRGTAIGVLLAVYGAAAFAATILPTIFGPTGPEVQAFALCAVVCVLAVWASRRWMPDLPGALSSQRLTIVSTALWAIGLVILVDGVVQVEGPFVVAGIVIVLVALSLRRIARAPKDEGVKARSAGAALAAGLVIGFSQAIPMIAMPAFFSSVQGVDALVASVMIAPFIAGLAASGPAAGWLLARYMPRRLIFVGVWTIAISDFLFFILLGQQTGYVAFIVLFAVLGIGFMVSTAVRTAVIFASTPRRLAGTAAALNEASLGVGTRLGITMVVVLQAGVLGTETGPLEWMRVALMAGAIVGVIGGVAVLILLGSLDPVRTVWDLRDEREAVTT